MSMRAARQPNSVHCFAESNEATWEAFCLDFDLAVQGRNFEDVYAKLNDQIALYIDSTASLPEADRQRLLSRHVPLSVTIPLLLRMIGSVVLRLGATPRHDYTIPFVQPATA